MLTNTPYGTLLLGGYERPGSAKDEESDTTPEIAQ
jgi:hypothetical protein